MPKPPDPGVGGNPLPRSAQEHEVWAMVPVAKIRYVMKRLIEDFIARFNGGLSVTIDEHHTTVSCARSMGPLSAPAHGGECRALPRPAPRGQRVASAREGREEQACVVNGKREDRPLSRRTTEVGTLAALFTRTGALM